MKIEILGTGCTRCKKLFENTTVAVNEAKVNADIVKVEDIQKIMGYGVMSTPAIVIDGEVKAAGRVLNPDEIKRLITK